MTCQARGVALSGILWLATAILGAQEAHASDQSALDPHGPVAARIATLANILFAIATTVFVVVLAFLIIGIVRRRQAVASSTAEGTPDSSRTIVVGGIILPAIILVAVFAYTLRDMIALAGPDQPAAVTIDVIGHQWWWEVKYPDDDVTTANEIHVPVGEPVTIRLTTGDVIHSFWVPELISKRDLIPGRDNDIWLQADQAGAYRGQCAEFCGVQHAFMAFLVIAEPPDQFASWLSHQNDPATDPTDPALIQGQHAFLGSACVYCHTVKGTVATGVAGPDLTHLASRQTLAAGTLSNTRGSLSGWIADPQSIKPGNYMPNLHLDPGDLQAIVAYLESLR
jgi:cytochrome c oxidase subunit 2